MMNKLLAEKTKNIKEHLSNSIDSVVKKKETANADVEREEELSELDRLKADLELIDDQQGSKIAKLKTIIGKKPSPDEQKLELLRAFSIPDKREDISEFMALCRLRQQWLRTELHTKLSQKERDGKNLLMSMWASKHEEAFQKGLRMYPEDEEFRAIQDERDRIKALAEAKRKKKIYSVAGIAAACIAALGIFGISSSVKESSRAKEYNETVQASVSSDMDEIQLADAEIVTSDVPIERNIPQTNKDSVDEDEEDTKEGSESIDSKLEDITIPVFTKTQKNGFNDKNGRSIVGKYGFSIPLYWKSSLRNNDNYVAYAETGNKVAMLQISSSVDEEAPVSFDILKEENDNGGITKSFDSWYETISNVTSEEFSNDVIRGYLYSINYINNGLQGEAKCLIFPSETDNCWMYVSLSQTDNTEYYYDKDFLKILNAIDDTNIEGEYSYDLEKAQEHLEEIREERKQAALEAEQKAVTKSSPEPEQYTVTVDIDTNTEYIGYMVWITDKGSKYHSRSSCSNMRNPYQVSEAEAISWGYTPCSRCY